MKRLIVANWKMNPGSTNEARMLAHQIEHGLLNIERGRVDVSICPPFVFSPLLKHALHFVRLGAQDIAAYESGAHTGEVSASQLSNFGTSLVIVGHSERRALGEDDKMINAKIHVALAHKLEPILCVGFGTKKAMTLPEEKKIIGAQLRKGLKEVKVREVKFAILYEPVWAISGGLGSGSAVAPSHAASMIGWMKSRFPEARVLYGGSIDSKNATGFAAERVIEGGVVGAASLKPAEFLEIVKAFSKPI